MPDLLNTFSYNINKSHLWESKIKTVFAVNIKSLILLVFIFNRIFYTTYEKYINKKSILFHSWWNRRGKKYDILITNRLLCNHVNIYITSAIIDKNEKNRKKYIPFTLIYDHVMATVFSSCQLIFFWRETTLFIDKLKIKGTGNLH